MAGDVRIRITGSDETRAAFASVEAGAKKVERALSGLTKFSLGSAGIGVGFAALAIHLNHVAEKLKDTNPAAAEFVDSMDRLKALTERGLVEVFAGLNPILKELADDAEAMANWIAEAVKNLKIYEAERDKQRAADPLYYTNSQAFKDYQANQAAKNPPMKVVGSGFIDRSNSNEIINARAFLSALYTAQQNAEVEAAKETAQKIADIRFKAAAHGYDMEAQYAEHMAEEIAKADKAVADKRAEDERGLSDYFGALDLKRVKEQNAAQKELQDKQLAAAKTFGDLFADVLVQSNKDGLKGVLADFLRTLAIMAARAQAMKLFNMAASSGGAFGSAITAIFGAAGFAGGGDFTVGGSGGPDSQYVPLALTPGERVSIRQPGQSSGNVVNITQNVDASGSDPVAVARAMRVAEQSAIAKIRDLQKRGR